MKPKAQNIVIFANGHFPAPGRLIAKITDQDFLIAADGGLKFCTQFNLTPNLIIGDLDSADPLEIERFQIQGIKVDQYPVEKDETDLELALEAAINRGPSSIWVVAALGDRLDQTLANIFLLTQPQFKNSDIRLMDGLREVFLIRKETALLGNPGDRVSLIPLTKRVTGIKTKGLQFPLDNETLFREKTRGISNRMTTPSSSVEIKKGLLLCVHEFSDSQERTGENV